MRPGAVLGARSAGYLTKRVCHSFKEKRDSHSCNMRREAKKQKEEGNRDTKLADKGASSPGSLRFQPVPGSGAPKSPEARLAPRTPLPIFLRLNYTECFPII